MQQTMAEIKKPKFKQPITKKPNKKAAHQQNSNALLDILGVDSTTNKKGHGGGLGATGNQSSMIGQTTKKNQKFTTQYGSLR